MRLVDADKLLSTIDNPVQYRTLKRLLDEAETVEVKGDLISKKSLRDALRKHFVPDPNKAPDYLVDFLMDVNGVLEHLPTEKSEIVRCKDCKYYSPMNRETKTGICNLTMHQNFGDNWFCAGAERRTDGRTD